MTASTRIGAVALAISVAALSTAGTAAAAGGFHGRGIDIARVDGEIVPAGSFDVAWPCKGLGCGRAALRPRLSTPR